MREDEQPVSFRFLPFSGYWAGANFILHMDTPLEVFLTLYSHTLLLTGLTKQRERAV